jgi:EmrB/QacA subfamily drug resistance transporter
MSFDDVQAASGRLPLLAQVGLMMGPLLSMIDESVINVALPDIARNLDASLSTVQWVISGYLLSLSAFLAITAYLSRRFGTLQAYTACLVGFTVGSALCACAPNVQFLIAARILQGAMGAPLLPLGMMLIQRSSRTKYGISPALGIMLFLAPALGPTLAGVLIHWFGWSSIFLINVPIGVAGFVTTLRIPKGEGDVRDPSEKFDPVGLFTLSCGLGLAAYGSATGPLQGWLSSQSWPFWGSSVFFLLFYLFWALRRPSPALDIKLLRRLQNSIAISLCALTTAVSFSIIVLAPVFMEQTQGFSTYVTGLALFPQAMATILGFEIGGKLVARYGVRTSVITGTLLLTAGTLLLHAVHTDTPAWCTAILLVPRSIGSGLVTQPMLQRVLNGLSPKESADANTIFNVTQRLGAGIGTALLTTYFQLRENARIQEVLSRMHVSGSVTGNVAGSNHLPALPPSIRHQLTQAGMQGFHDSVWMIAAVSLVGLLIAFLVKDAPAEKEPHKRPQRNDTFHLM